MASATTKPEASSTPPSTTSSSDGGNNVPCNGHFVNGDMNSQPPNGNNEHYPPYSSGGPGGYPIAQKPGPLQGQTPTLNSLLQGRHPRPPPQQGYGPPPPGPGPAGPGGYPPPHPQWGHDPNYAPYRHAGVSSCDYSCYVCQ